MRPSPPRHTTLTGGAVLVGLLGLASLAAPCLAPYDPAEVLDPFGGGHRPPFTRLAAIELANGRWWLAEEVRRTPGGLHVRRRDAAMELPEAAVLNLTTEGVADRRFFLLGSDRFGRDLLSRLLWGGRVSLSIGLLATLLAATVGIAVGGLAGVAGGAIDLTLMRLVDAALALPRLFLLLAVAALFRGGSGLVILLLGLTSWMAPSRLARGEIRAAGQREFVLAARSCGVSPFAIFRRHLLPNALPPLVIDAALRVGDLVLIEAALSFLGLGVEPPRPTWGNIVADGRDALAPAWWVATFPGLAITLAVVGFNLLGDGLRQRLDPRGETRAG